MKLPLGLQLRVKSAVAAGLTPRYDAQAENPTVFVDDQEWNPLVYPAQAFYLIAQLQLVVVPGADASDNQIYVYYGWTGDRVVEPVNDQMHNSLMLAITKAATACTVQKST